MTENQLRAAILASLCVTGYLGLVPTHWVWVGLVVSVYFTVKLIRFDSHYLNVGGRE